MKKNKSLLIFLYLFILIVGIGLVSVPAIILSFLTTYDFSLLSLIVNGISIIFFSMNLIIGSKLDKKYKTMKGQDYLNLLDEKKNEIVDVQKIREKIIKSYRLGSIYTFCSYLFLLASSFTWCLNFRFFGNEEPALIQLLQFIIGAVNAGFFLGVLINLSVNISSRIIDKKFTINNNYEIFNKLVKEVLDEEKITDSFETHIIYGTICSIAQKNKRIKIEIGTYLLATLSKEEIKSILYHELAHYKQKDTEYSSKVYNYYNFLTILNHEHSYKITCPFIPSIIYKSEISSFLVSLYYENLADDYVLEKDVAKDYINANIKIFGMSKTEPVTNSEIIYQVFKNNAWTEDYIKAYYEHKIAFYNKYLDIWKLASDKHLKLTYTSHPNIKERKEKFKIKDINIELKLSYDFDNDLTHFYNELNRLGFEEQNKLKFIKDYEEFISLKKTYEIDQFNNDITKINNLLYFAFDFGDYELSKVLAKKVLAVYPNKEKEIFILGAILIAHEFNEEGISYLNKLIELGTSTHSMQAMNLLADYYVMTGNEEGRNRIKELQVGIVDNQIDLDELLNLKITDKLTPFTDLDVINNLVRLVEKCNSISQVSIGVKTLKNKTCTHVVVFRAHNFKETEIEDVLNNIFLYLDSIDGQFNLLCVHKNMIPKKHYLLRKSYIIYKKEDNL